MKTRTKEQIDEYLSNVELQKTQEPLNRQELEIYFDGIKFLSPNEPITPYGVQRLLDQINTAIQILELKVGIGEKTITIWNPNISYQKGNVVLHFKQESKQVSPEIGKRDFVFLLVSLKNNNDSIPNYDLVDGIPNFTKSNWQLLNPMSYLLQDLIQLKQIVKEVMTSILDEHIRLHHGLIGGSQIEQNLLRNDYSNLISPHQPGKFSLSIKNDNGMSIHSNGILEYSVKYSFDEKANPVSDDVKISDPRHYHQKSPIFDESDQTIFMQKYIEEDMFSVMVNPRQNENGVETATYFNNLRYGTNIFHAHIEFPTPFFDDEYCVFFDTYGYGQFVFGYDKLDIQSKEQPTYDAIVSMPMIMNKTPSGFDVVLPIHTYFNSIQKYRIGVPWKNEFTLQAIGRYR